MSVLQSKLSTNEEFEFFGDGDDTASITGYVDSIVAPKRAGPAQERLFKFFVTNGSKRITVLIWGDDLVDKFSSKITPNMVLEINGAYSKVTSMSTFKKKQNLVGFELFIRGNTEISFLGDYGVESKGSGKMAKVTFDTVKVATGLIQIRGYIRTKFNASRNKIGTTRGIGAITNGTHKLTVVVKDFSESCLEIGDFVTVIGTVNDTDDIVTIYCENLSGITPDTETPSMLPEQTQRGGRLVLRNSEK